MVGTVARPSDLTVKMEGGRWMTVCDEVQPTSNMLVLIHTTFVWAI